MAMLVFSFYRVPTIVPEARQNRASRANNRQLALGEVEESERFTRNISRCREADFRSANRHVPDLSLQIAMVVGLATNIICSFGGAQRDASVAVTSERSAGL
jgi:hypothetical protein